MIKRVAHIILSMCVLFICACNDMSSNNHGPIVLGDSSSIVTEKDPQRLQDLVTDLKPDIPTAEEKDSSEAKQQEVVAAVVDTTKKTKVINPPLPPASVKLSGNGLLAEFKDVSVLISNVNAKQAGNTNLQRANGAVYTLVSGNINGSQIKLTGNITKVSQRYQTVVLYKNSLGTLQLDAFNTTTDWEPLKGGNNQYRITGLDASSLDFPDANPNAIRNAITKSARRRRISHRTLEEMLNSVHRVRSLNQKPLTVVLRSVMWKIDGKDAQGRSFSKQIRVDIPL